MCLYSGRWSVCFLGFWVGPVSISFGCLGWKIEGAAVCLRGC